MKKLLLIAFLGMNLSATSCNYIDKLYKRIGTIHKRIMIIEHKAVLAPLCDKLKVIWIEILMIRRELLGVELDVILIDDKINKQ